MNFWDFPLHASSSKVGTSRLADVPLGNWPPFVAKCPCARTCVGADSTAEEWPLCEESISNAFFCPEETSGRRGVPHPRHTTSPKKPGEHPRIYSSVKQRRVDPSGEGCEHICMLTFIFERVEEGSPQPSARGLRAVNGTCVQAWRSRHANWFLACCHSGCLCTSFTQWASVSTLGARQASFWAFFFFAKEPIHAFCRAPFRLVKDMDQPTFSWGYGLAPFRLGIWTAPFPVGDMDWPLSS